MKKKSNEIVLLEEIKPFFKSKTMWANGLIILAGVATWASGQVEAGLPITLAGILNSILRVVTKSGIYFRNGPEVEIVDE